jgi:hypothetical protein
LSNNFYNHSDGVPVSQSRGSSSAIRAEFDLVQQGFDKMPSLVQMFSDSAHVGIDSGSASTYVVVGASAITSLSEGMAIEFKALNTCNAGAKIQFNGLTAVDIVRPDGTAILAGDIQAGMYARFRVSGGKFQHTNGANAAASASATAAAASASASATSATNSSNSATLSQNWATQTASEVVVGQGYGAKKYAQDAATSASNASTSAGNAATSATNSQNSATASATAASNIVQTKTGLTQLIALSLDRMWRDVYAGGWRPSFFNQQWGGAQFGTEMVDGATGQLYKLDVATGLVEDNGTNLTSDSSADTYCSQGFKLSESQSITAVWLKAYKVGNPANNLQVSIVTDDGTGKPLNATPVTNGTATAQSGKLHTSKTDGEWYRFVFPTPPALSGNTQYHILTKSSGAVDAANYWVLKRTTTSKYPFGVSCNGNATPVFSAIAGSALNFIVEPVAAAQFFQSNGQFGGKLVFAEGSPLNQSKALINPLRNFFDPQEATLLHRVSSCVKGKPISDYLYGLDHDRILLMCDATTGYASVRLYKQDGTLLTITGNTDVSGASLSDIAVNFRAKGDGADYLKLFVNGTQQAALTAQTITFDPLMRELGHAWLGGGFAAAPTWTQKLDMSSLPSANGWTWTGTGTEANCMSVSGGKLYQNKNGYGATDTGYYSKSSPGFNNAVGSAHILKARVVSGTNSKGIGGGITAYIQDGARTTSILLQEYFLQRADAGAYQETTQINLQSTENVLLSVSKGNDSFVFCNGRLVTDATNVNVASTALNAIVFGDSSGTSGENTDAVYDYVAYYNTAAILPQIATGMALHEYAHWSGDKSSYLSSLYNSGSPISVKQFTGMHRNYVDVVEWSEERKGITLSPTTTATSPTLLPDMESFVLGERFDISYGGSTLVSAAVQSSLSAVVDGVAAGSSYMSDTSTNSPKTQFHQCYVKPYFGMHKVEGRWSVPGGGATLTEYNTRKIQIRSSK